MRLGPGAEFEAIRAMIASAGHSAQHIGDDAAVLDLPNGGKLVVSTDTSVEDVHFKREWMTFEEIGFRAVASALSDLAAVGASPVGVVVAYGVPTRDRAALVDIARGAGAAATASRTTIVGGDVSSSGTITITATVLGISTRPLLRNSAKSGDAVYVTGTLGGARLALDALQSGQALSAAAREKFVKPAPRIREALWLVSQGANACIDISDGLGGDLGHIAAASSVSMNIDPGAIPLFPGSTARGAVASGEEYELCVTIPHEIDAAAFEALFEIPLTRIGTVVESGEAQVNFGAGFELDPQDSFNHFVNDHQ